VSRSLALYYVIYYQEYVPALELQQRSLYVCYSLGHVESCCTINGTTARTKTATDAATTTTQTTNQNTEIKMLEYIVIHYNAKLSILSYPLTPYTTLALACIREIGEYGWL
jgi:hypothetical protein